MWILSSATTTTFKLRRLTTGIFSPLKFMSNSYSMLFGTTASPCKKSAKRPVCNRVSVSACALTRTCTHCMSADYVDVPKLPRSRPGTQRQEKCCCLCVFVLGAIIVSLAPRASHACACRVCIHVRTYLLKWYTYVDLYYDTYRGTTGICITVNNVCMSTKNNVHLEIMSCRVLFYQPLHVHQDRKSNSRAPLKTQKSAHFSLVSFSFYYPRSRRGVERIRQGEGRWSCPLKTAFERIDTTENFQFRESHTEAGTDKNADQIPVPSKSRTIVYILYVKYDIRCSWLGAHRHTRDHSRTFGRGAS